VALVELEEEPAPTVAAGAAPLVTYDYSDDRGNSYINARTTGDGVHANTSRRLWWNRNGSSYGRVMRLAGVGTRLHLCSPGAVRRKLCL
jgi:hypothetical protein